MYAVRLAAAGDAPTLLSIDEHFDGHSHPEIVARALGEGRIVVAECDGGGIVGYVHWGYFWDSIPMCVTARVLEQHRRRGLGRRLYETVESDLRRRGHAFWLSSTEETNDVSQRFHEALGFRRIGVLAELGQDVEEIFYRKDLGEAHVAEALRPPVAT